MNAVSHDGSRSLTCEQFSHDFRPDWNTDHGAETCVQVSRESHPSGTDGDGRRAVVRLYRHRRQHGWTCPQLPVSTWVCARQTTDRDLASVILDRKKKTVIF